MGQIDKTDLEVFKDLIWFDAVRGMDNTGVASTKYGDDDIRFLKVVGTPAELFDRKSLPEVICEDTSFLMGHNRSKTTGTLAAKNAHPFVFDGIVGAHNGTLFPASKNRMQDGHKFDTDSEAMYNNINSFGIEKTLEKMDGAWALTWYDRLTKEMNFLRNKERPLYFVLDKSGSTLYWASESGILYLALNRNGVEWSGDDIKEVPENTLIRFQINSEKGYVLDKPIYRPKMEAPIWTYQSHPHENKHIPRVGSEMGPSVADARRHFRSFGLSEDERTKRIREIVDRPQPPLLGNRVVQGMGLKKCGHVTCEDGKCLVPRTPTIFDNKNKSLDLLDQWRELEEKGKLLLTRCLKWEKHKPGSYKNFEGQVLEQADFEKLMNNGCAVCSSAPAYTEPVKFLRKNDFICAVCMLDYTNRAAIVDLIELNG